MGPLSNLRQGSGAIDSSVRFSASNGAPSNVTINGLLSGTTNTLVFTVSGIDASQINASILEDGTVVRLFTQGGHDSVTYLVDEYFNIKTAAPGVQVMEVTVNSSGPYVYSKARVPQRAMA